MRKSVLYLLIALIVTSLGACQSKTEDQVNGDEVNGDEVFLDSESMESDSDRQKDEPLTISLIDDTHPYVFKENGEYTDSS